MLCCVRTTINLPDALTDAVKERARAQGRTFTSLVEEGLRAVLAVEPERGRRPLPAYGDPSASLLVDLDDRDALWSALGDDDAS